MAIINSNQNLTQEQADLNLRVLNLIINRVLKKIYINLDEDKKNNMKEILSSDDKNRKEYFIKNSIPNFNKIFEDEAKRIEEEIKEEIEKLI